MKKIRVGNDVWVRFAIIREEILENLPPADKITVTVENISRWNESLSTHEMTAIDGIVSFLIKGTETLDDEDKNKYLGKYRVTISYQLPDPLPATGQSLHTVDAVAFELVQFSSLQGEAPHACPELAVERVELVGNVATGQDGKSAYQVAVSNGFVGTEQEWLESLDGDDGKTAYQSALDGGLPINITEDEFYEILAVNSNMISEILDVINGEGESDVIAGKLIRLGNTKKAIAEGIEYHREEVSESDTFASYAVKIKELVPNSKIEEIYRDYGFGYALGEDGALAEAARQSYEITKGWTDYSKARDNRKIRFVPLLGLGSVTNMQGAFYNCTSLLSFPPLDTSSVTDMGNTFQSCTSLPSIPPLDTSSVTNMQYTFYNCTSLPSIPLLDTSNVTNMDGAFYNCTNMNALPLLNTSNVTSMSGTFYNCTALANLGGFKGLKASLDLSSCSKLTVDSLLNVFAHMADMTGLTAPILKLGTSNLAKLTPAQKAIATNKNWTLA